MHKNDLVRRVAADCGVSRAMTARLLNRALETIAAEVAQGNKVVLTGFGTFEARHRRERHGVDPRTAADITVPATRTPGFTAGAAFKARVGRDASRHR